MDPAIVTLAAGCSRPSAEPLLQPMFAARKRVFVDLLRWDVPVVSGRYEIDQFDDAHAEYLVVSGPDGRHRASARLLKSTRPHILGDLFPELSTEPVTRGLAVREITRFCLDPEAGARGRREARDILVSALVDHALACGISRYTGVAEPAWRDQVLRFGWACHSLGPLQATREGTLGALAIDIALDTPQRLMATGLYRPTALRPMDARASQPALVAA